MSDFRPTDAELMQSVDWLGSPEAGLKLPPEFLSPVSDAIKLARKQEKRIGELEAERDEALREHTDMVWQRRRAEEQADYATHLLKLTQDRLTAERKRREECEAALREVEITGDRYMARQSAAAYFSRYPSESDNLANTKPQNPATLLASNPEA